MEIECYCDRCMGYGPDDDEELTTWKCENCGRFVSPKRFGCPREQCQEALERDATTEEAQA